MPRPKRRRDDDRMPRNVAGLLRMLLSWGMTGAAPEEIEAVAVLLHRLRQQYGDREWTEREVLTVLDQLVGESSSLESTMKSIGL